MYILIRMRVLIYIYIYTYVYGIYVRIYFTCYSAAVAAPRLREVISMRHWEGDWPPPHELYVCVCVCLYLERSWHAYMTLGLYLELYLERSRRACMCVIYKTYIQVGSIIH